MLEPLDNSIGITESSVQALVLERHAASRIGFGLLLRSQPWIERCLLSSDRDEAVGLASRLRPDVAIVDVTEAGPFVSSYIAPLHSARPAMSLLLSVRDDAALTVAAALPGAAAGVITPAHSVDEVIAAVRHALVGQPLPERAGRATGPELSAREREVLMLLSTGATNREIAAAMHVSAETVKKHAAALYRKLGVRNRTEAAQLAPEVSTPA